MGGLAFLLKWKQMGLKPRSGVAVQHNDLRVIAHRQGAHNAVPAALRFGHFVARRSQGRHRGDLSWTYAPLHRKRVHGQFLGLNVDSVSLIYLLFCRAINSVVVYIWMVSP